MLKVKELRKAIGKFLFNFGEVTADDGTVLLFEGEELVEGSEVKTYDSNGEVAPLSGQFKLGELTYFIEDSKCVKIEKPEVEENPAEVVEEVKEVEAAMPAEVTEEVIEEVIDEVPAEVPADETLKALEDLAAKYEDLKKLIEELQRKLATVEATPAAEEIVPVKLSKTEKNANNAARILGA